MGFQVGRAAKVESKQEARAQETRRNLLEAAKNVVMHEGVGQLTIERVAQEAGVSKGAVLYHFVTKNALIEGMIGQHIRESDDCITRFAAEETGPGKITRAFIQAEALEGEKMACAESGNWAGMLAAVANNPELLARLREHYTKWTREMENDGIDLVSVTIIRLVAAGLSLNELTGIQPVRGEEHEKVIARLLEMATPEKD